MLSDHENLPESDIHTKHTRVIGGIQDLLHEGVMLEFLPARNYPSRTIVLRASVSAEAV